MHTLLLVLKKYVLLTSPVLDTEGADIVQRGTTAHGSVFTTSGVCRSVQMRSTDPRRHGQVQRLRTISSCGGCYCIFFPGPGATCLVSSIHLV